jgi:uncharacterized protein YutE (UPF0331/DUF86 family)
MTPDALSERVVADRLSWVHSMLDEIRALPLGRQEAFFSDRRNVSAAESCLRRALEALLDLGRHILAKSFGRGVTEYKEIAEQLERVGVLDKEQGALLRTLAGYRNRLVHFYHEISDLELYTICTQQLGDIETVTAALAAWIEAHPELIDRSL